MTTLAPANLPRQIDRPTAEYLHHEISKAVRGSRVDHYAFVSDALGRRVDSLCQIYTFELVAVITAIGDLERNRKAPKAAPVLEPVEQPKVDRTAPTADNLAYWTAGW